MRCLKINRRTIYYALYTGKAAETDTDGNYTGDYVETYADPVELKVNISPAKGRSSIEMFGDEEDYTRTMVTDDMSCPIVESTLLWVSVNPATHNPNYRVTRVARSLHHITYAIEEIANP